MLKAVRNIVVSNSPPTDKKIGWLKPIKGKLLEMRFFLNGAWRPVSDVAASELGELYLTSIKADVEEPLILDVDISNGVATIKGRVDISGIPISEIDKLFEEN